MKKQKIRIELEDETGDKKCMVWEIDIAAMETFSVMEGEILSIGGAGTDFLMRESLKKNRRWWWSKRWRTILAWCGTAAKPFASKRKPVPGNLRGRYCADGKTANGKD